MILKALGLAFTLMLKLREYAYRIGLRRSYELPHAKVISVGNISVGGTGKSPLVERLAVEALGRRQGVLVLSRGYGRRNKQDLFVESGGEAPSAEDVGDEPAALRARLPQIRLFVSQDRARRAFERWSELQVGYVIADDAFQHWKLTRDCDVVTVDATEKFPGAPLPGGRLRESPLALSRADFVVVTRTNEGVAAPAVLKTRIRAFMGQNQRRWPWRRESVREPKIFFTEHFPVSISRGRELLGTDFLRGKAVFLIAGIARPESFQKTCERLGAHVKGLASFPDHHWLTGLELAGLEQKFLASGAEILLTTEKDFARWQNLSWPILPYVVRVRLRFVDPETLLPSPEAEHEFLSSVFPRGPQGPL